MADIDLTDLVHTADRFLIGTRAFTNGKLAIGSAATKAKTAAAVDYTIAGVMYSKAATDDLFVHTDLTVQADGETKYYLLSLNAAGTALITAGDAGGVLPTCPALNCPVGYLKIVADGASFTPATTDHDAANITTTYVNLSTMPLSV